MASKPVVLTKELLRHKRQSALAFINVDPAGNISLKDEVKALIQGDNELTRYVEGVVKTIPSTDNPKLLSDFHYEYKNGKLVNITNGEAFHWVNQYHYDALGDIIVTHIQKMMMDVGLVEKLLPLDDEEGPHVNIFVSKDWDSCNTLMLLIQGSGAVRAGQWARALCINENLDIGTVLPYLKRCKDLGYGVIVLNPNVYTAADVVLILRKHMLTQEKVVVNRSSEEKREKIKGSETRGNHITYVWDNFVEKSKAKVVVAVAHSAGGDGTAYLIEHRLNNVYEKLAAVAFTDSVHSMNPRDPPDMIKFVKTRCRNWVTVHRSKKPLDEVVSQPDIDCLRVSAGHDTHEYTSGFAINSVFWFLQEAVKNFGKPLAPSPASLSILPSEPKPSPAVSSPSTSTPPSTSSGKVSGPKPLKSSSTTVPRSTEKTTEVTEGNFLGSNAIIVGIAAVAVAVGIVVLYRRNNN